MYFSIKLLKTDMWQIRVGDKRLVLTCDITYFFQKLGEITSS